MQTTTTRLTALRHLLAEVADLRHAADLVEWDERVCMPDGGATVHGEMQATLRRLAHEKFTSAAMAELVGELRGELLTLDTHSDEHRLIAVTARDYDKATRVPPEFVAEHARVVSAAQQAWAHSREASDFASFAPHLSAIVELKRQYVTFFPPAAHAYDLLLDEYEPGLTTADVMTLFAELRPRQTDLIRRVAEQPQIDDGFVRAGLSEAVMLRFSEDVMSQFGFDWTRGRQDKSVHPFATAIGANDVRITTRFVESRPFSLFFGTMHETGHALYEQGVSPAYHRTSLEGGASLGVHESQSRLWENMVGRSLPFWEHFLPSLQQRFPTLGDIPLRDFYRAINRVERSPIRVEADEATYNLHVMLRVELEIALIEGAVQVADLPDEWNRRMREYLGIVPDNAAEGVLQDIHWSAGLFGYFATYTLGNVIAAQLWDAFGRRHPDRDDGIRRGDFSTLRLWLQHTLHRHGRKYQPQELVEQATGSRIDPTPYLRYLEQKYFAVYGIR